MSEPINSRLQHPLPGGLCEVYADERNLHFLCCSNRAQAMASSVLSTSSRSCESSTTRSQITSPLDFSHSKPVGRQEAVNRLHVVYRYVQQGGTSLKGANGAMKEASTVAMIRGLSGTGKSTLAKQFMDDLERISEEPGGPVKPFFLYGKFDDLSGTDPFSALIDAFNGFANALVHGEKEEVDLIRDSIKENLGMEAKYLTAVVPSLKSITGDTGHNLCSMENASNRLKYAFQNFANTISTKLRPVLLVLDDLQWCDAASAELIEALLTDSDLRHLMFLGTYRSDEMGKESSFYENLRAIENRCQVENIELMNLSFQETKLFVSDVLHTDVNEMESLARMVYKKTNGNIFFVKQVLDELNRNHLLVRSKTTLKWEWRLGDKDVHEFLSDDVMKVVAAKLHRAPRKLQRVLTVAAYSRSTIDFHTLRRLLELDSFSPSEDSLLAILDKAVLDGHLMNNMGSNSYSFAHDRIQQAAYNLVPTGEERNEFRYTMGQRLYQMGKEEKSEEWMLYAAADHLNATARVLGKDPLFQIKVNLEAGEKAASCAAFEMASKYLGFARQDLLLLGDPWESHYETTLKVYQTTVDVRLCQGHLEIGKSIGEEVLRKAKSSDDKMPVQLALAHALGREEKHKESLRMSVATLRLLNEYPAGALSIHANLTRDLLYVRRYFKKKSDEEVLSLPFMKNKRKEYIMAFLCSSSYQAFYCGNMVSFLYAILRMLRISIKHGLSGLSAVGLTGYCLFCNNINDKEGAMRFCGLAKKVQKMTNAKHLEALQLFVVAHWIGGWKDMHEDVLETYYEAYKSGMESGDFENGLLSRTASFHHEFVAGFDLKPLNAKFSDLVLKLQGYKIDAVLQMTLQQWFVVQHLIGTATSPFTDFEDPKTRDSSDTYRLVYGYLARLQLAVYFGDYDFAETMSEKLSPIAQFDKSHSVNSLGLFFSSVAYATLSRVYKKRAYAKKARKFLNQLTSLCKAKGANSWHRCSLMEAHLRAVVGSNASTARKGYDEAIVLALKTGHKQDAALGALLAAEHFLTFRGDSLSSHLFAKARDLIVRTYLRESRELFNEWGATKLVAHLEQKYGEYLDSAPANVDHPNVLNLEETVAPPDAGAEIDRDRANYVQKDDISVLTDNSALWKHPNGLVNTHRDLDKEPVMEVHSEGSNSDSY
eukprot:scaffold22560_cov135-Cylindrotheca_fusiformis.AAC.74